MFIKESNIKRNLKRFSLKIFNAIENNANDAFDKNGEKIFIENLFKHLSKSDKKKKVIFDIGANVGEYSTMLENISKANKLEIDLHLFEPTKRCFSIIKKLFNAEAVTLNNCGVSNKNESATIFYDKETSGLASLYQRNLDSYSLKLNKNEQIELIRLDGYIKEKNIKHIDFIKIDIEGHELTAFDGFGDYLNSDFIDFIQFEYGGANLDSHTSLMEIYESLVNKGFKVAKIMPNGLQIREYSPYMDNFQYSNYVAISNSVLKKW